MENLSGLENLWAQNRHLQNQFEIHNWPWYKIFSFAKQVRGKNVFTELNLLRQDFL